MSPSDTVKAIHEQGGIAIAAHPFTHLLKFIDLHGIGCEIGELPLDAVEVRNSVPVELYSNWITYLYNRRHRNHPTVGGSDTHFMTMLGQTYTWFAGDTAEDFRRCLVQRKVKPGGSVNGPRLAAELAAYFLQQKQLPKRWSDDRHYRHQTSDLIVEVEELRHIPIAILHCTGRITRDNADLLKADLLRLLQGNITKIVVDLTDVTFVDSAGLGAIIASQKRAWQVKGNIVIANPSKAVALTFQLVRLDKLFKIHSTVKTAIATLQNGCYVKIDSVPQLP
jgi:anti-sigma B factor antagonist